MIDVFGFYEGSIYCTHIDPTACPHCGQDCGESRWSRSRKTQHANRTDLLKKTLGRLRSVFHRPEKPVSYTPLKPGCYVQCNFCGELIIVDDSREFRRPTEGEVFAAALSGWWDHFERRRLLKRQ